MRQKSTGTSTGTPMQPGRYYQRPCVRAAWPNGSGKPQWTPIIGPPHSDSEIIRFHPRHWHADFRFLRKSQRQISPLTNHPVFSTPISIVVPETGTGTTRVPVDQLPSPVYPEESYLRIMPRSFQQHYPGYPFSRKTGNPIWLPQLEAAYRDRTLAGMTCPHRGASLEGMEPDPEGCVTCPLHGLRWHLGSGRLRPLSQHEKDLEESKKEIYRI